MFVKHFLKIKAAAGELITGSEMERGLGNPVTAGFLIWCASCSPGWANAKRVQMKGRMGKSPQRGKKKKKEESNTCCLGKMREREMKRWDLSL